MSWLLSDGTIAVVARRTLTIGLHLVATVVLLASAPLLLALTAAVDVLRSLWRWSLALRWAWSRILLLLLAYLVAELIGLVVAAWLWLRHAAWLGFSGSHGPRRWRRYLDANYRLQELWLSAMGGAGFALYSIRLQLEGEEWLLGGGPILLFIRHASVGDTVLAGMLLQARHGYRLRYVLKRRLLLDPCFDVVGNRLPNHFVWRNSERSAEEVAAVARLADDLDADEGVLIYPEGTRFTEAKRQRILSDLAERGGGAELERAQSLRHVLPPRRGGPLALLETNARSSRPADVLFCAHAGFEGAADIGELSNGGLVGRTVYIRFWRIPASDVPPSPESRAAWLHEQWERVDEFVEEHRCSQ